ncbi:MAG: hypothetical protein JWR78_2726 [Mycobacterium sp.]|nr:hypothetical protein [Mycobacterium sp.]
MREATRSGERAFEIGAGTHLADDEDGFRVELVGQRGDLLRGCAHVLAGRFVGAQLWISVARRLSTGCLVHGVSAAVHRATRGVTTPMHGHVGTSVVDGHHQIGRVLESVFDDGNEIGQRRSAYDGSGRPAQQRFVDEDAVAVGDEGTATSTARWWAVQHGAFQRGAPGRLDTQILELPEDGAPAQLQLRCRIRGVVGIVVVDRREWSVVVQQVPEAVGVHGCSLLSMVAFLAKGYGRNATRMQPSDLFLKMS